MAPSLRFDNAFVRELPADPEGTNRRRQVLRACYSRVLPTRVRAPRMLAFVPEVAALLGLDPDDAEDPALVEALGGNRVLPGMEPWAACYGGHQFGSWAGQLGDGRAISLGEVVHDGARWEVQLKGAGPTPYSRSGDGRAVLRSSLRELVCSEAMHHLGVPTTRALSLVGTGEDVVRDMLYDGHPRPEPGAVVCRVAPSFLRFGSYEIFAARGDHETLERLCSHTVRRHFPELGEPGPDAYAAWLEEVARRTAVMVGHWMRVGFVHGVMNTDNMSVLGLTIDYGPYGWLDVYDPGWTPNTTDAAGRRYRFGHQPSVAWWNLVRFANAILPVVGAPGPLEAALDAFPEALEREQRRTMGDKLGLESLEEDDEPLVRDLLDLLGLVETDMTLFYRRLADVPVDEDADDRSLLAPLLDAHYATAPDDAIAATLAWVRRWAARARRDGSPRGARRARMNAANPKFVFRNYLAQLAIDDAEQGDLARLRELLDVLRRPYDEQPEHEALAARRPEWARDRPGCSMLSCSS